jgi:hypothetical protein
MLNFEFAIPFEQNNTAKFSIPQVAALEEEVTRLRLVEKELMAQLEEIQVRRNSVWRKKTIHCTKPN